MKNELEKINLGIVSKSHVFMKFNQIFMEEEEVEIEVINKGTGKTHIITHTVKDPEVYTDENGKIWKRIG